MNYGYAKETFKVLDAKETELQQYMLDSERKYKTLSNPVEKKSFEEKIQRDYKAKIEAMTRMKNQNDLTFCTVCDIISSALKRRIKWLGQKL